MKFTYTYIDFTQDDVNNATDDYDEVKDVPGISEVALHAEMQHTDTQIHYCTIVY